MLSCFDLLNRRNHSGGIKKVGEQWRNDERVMRGSICITMWPDAEKIKHFDRISFEEGQSNLNKVCHKSHNCNC